MGSFNTTCFASNQTIAPGVRTYIFPLEQQTTYQPVSLKNDKKSFNVYGNAHSGCYTVAHWKYCGPMLTGKYADYGEFELENTPENHINLLSFFEYLHGNLFETEPGPNEYHDVGIDFKRLYRPDYKSKYSFKELHAIWDKVWRVTQNYRAFVAGQYDGQPKPLQFGVMHHACAQYLIDLAQTTPVYGHANADQFAMFNEFLTEDRKFTFLFKFLDDDYCSRLSECITALPGYRMGDYEGVDIGSHYSETFELVERCVNSNKKFIEKNGALGAAAIQALFKIMKPQLDHRYINSGLEYLNLKLSPMVYASQDYSNELGAAYAKMVRRVSHLVTKEAKE